MAFSACRDCKPSCSLLLPGSRDIPYSLVLAQTDNLPGGIRTARNTHVRNLKPIHQPERHRSRGMAKDNVGQAIPVKVSSADNLPGGIRTAWDTHVHNLTSIHQPERHRSRGMAKDN